MGKREHSTWDIMANAKPEEEWENQKHGTNINKLRNELYNTIVPIYNNLDKDD